MALFIQLPLKHISSGSWKRQEAWRMSRESGRALRGRKEQLVPRPEVWDLGVT